MLWPEGSAWRPQMTRREARSDGSMWEGEGRGRASVEGDGGSGGVGHWMGREERGLG